MSCSALKVDLKTILLWGACLVVISSCSFKPPQNIPTFINKAGEVSLNTVTRFDHFEAQLALSPVKYLLLVGALKSKDLKNEGIIARHSFGMGCYFPIQQRKYTLEFLHLARQFDAFSGNLYGIMTAGSGNHPTSASGSYDFTQTRVAFYKNNPSQSKYGASLNFIHGKYSISSIWPTFHTPSYVSNNPYAMYAINLTFFGAIHLTRYVNLLHSFTISRTRLLDGPNPSLLVFSPFSLRIGIGFYFDRK